MDDKKNHSIEDLAASNDRYRKLIKCQSLEIDDLRTALRWYANQALYVSTPVSTIGNVEVEEYLPPPRILDDGWIVAVATLSGHSVESLAF